MERKIGPATFAAENFGDESIGEPIAKEIEKAGKKR